MLKAAPPGALRTPPPLLVWVEEVEAVQAVGLADKGASDDLPKAGAAVVAMGPDVVGLPMQKWEAPQRAASLKVEEGPDCGLTPPCLKFRYRVGDFKCGKHSQGLVNNGTGRLVAPCAAHSRAPSGLIRKADE
ncbi:hypothetical protein EYF80_019079 [Liparis tanakae]|uniref:Uncharacterized protein n=1 Tax=Liparis tanakae TaxID=230148 RepID=A0A4Z2I086_9TELE|nr:hypothetical protein EYF80_019079 [Liparis tanakae]